MERFKKNRISELFFSEAVEFARRRGWVCDEHFPVAGTLIEARGFLKLFRPKDEPPPRLGAELNDWLDFKGQERSNRIYISTTVPQACLARKGFCVRNIVADKGDPSREFVQGCRDRGIAPQAPCVRERKNPGLDERTTWSKAHRTSQWIRKRIEEPFGWRKTAGPTRKTLWGGIDRTPFMAQFFGSACNLLRMAKIAASETVKPPETVATA